MLIFIFVGRSPEKIVIKKLKKEVLKSLEEVEKFDTKKVETLAGKLITGNDMEFTLNTKNFKSVIN